MTWGKLNVASEILYYFPLRHYRIVRKMMVRAGVDIDRVTATWARWMDAHHSVESWALRARFAFGNMPSGNIITGFRRRREIGWGAWCLSIDYRAHSKFVLNCRRQFYLPPEALERRLISVAGMWRCMVAEMSWHVEYDWRGDQRYSWAGMDLGHICARSVFWRSIVNKTHTGKISTPLFCRNFAWWSSYGRRDASGGESLLLC